MAYSGEKIPKDEIEQVLGKARKKLVHEIVSCLFTSLVKLSLDMFSAKKNKYSKIPEGRVRRLNFQRVTLERNGCDLASSPWLKMDMMLKRPGSLIEHQPTMLRDPPKK